VSVRAATTRLYDQPVDLLVTVTFLTAACILLPLWLTRDRVILPGRAPLLMFFVAIGLGFMLIETSQMQRLIIALGHPIYGLSVVLFCAAPLEWSRQLLDRRSQQRRRGWCGAPAGLLILVGVLAVFGAATPAIVRWSEPMTTAVRIVAAVLVLFPAGVMMAWRFHSG
jgi:hypothetical protein